MTLADELRVHRPTDQPPILRDIFEAQKFVVDPTLLDLVRAQSMEVIQEGAQFVRLPYPLTWIEYTFREHGDRRAVGGLCRQKPGSSGGVFTLHVVSRLADTLQTEIVDRRVLCDLTDPGVIHFEAGGSDYTVHPPDAFKFERRGLGARANPIEEQTDLLMLGIAHVLIGSLMFLAARGGARVEPVHHDVALQRSRAKAGKPPLYSYARLRIDVAKHTTTTEPTGPGGGAARSPMRGHTVRGHFKTIRGRLCWWKPHIRGDLGRGFVVKTYDLQAHQEPTT